MELRNFRGQFLLYDMCTVKVRWIHIALLQSKLSIAKHLIFNHINLVDMILSSLKKFPTDVKDLYSRTQNWNLVFYSASESKIMSKSYNGIYNSSQGVYEPTETHLKSTAGNRIMAQQTRRLKFSIKSFLNRCILCMSS